MRFCVLTLLIVQLGGCGSSPAVSSKPPLAPPPALPSVTAPAVEAAKEASAANVPLAKVEAAVNAMPASDLRTKALSGLTELRQWWSTNLAKWDATVEQARAQDQIVIAINKAMSDRDARIKQSESIAKLEAGDPVVTRLNYAGLACLVAAVAALGVGIWLNIVALRTLSFVLGGVGLAILTLARYLHSIEAIVGGIAIVAAIGAVVYLIIHKKVMPAVVAARATIADVVSDVPSTSATAPTQDTGAVAPAVTGGA